MVEGRKWISILLVVLLCGIRIAQAVDFYQDDTISQGTYVDVHVYDIAILTVTGGNIEALKTFNASTANIYEGDIYSIQLLDSSIVNLYGGQIDRITYFDTSTLNVYGYDFSYMPVASSGWLYGKWANNQSFAIYLRDCSYPSDQIELHEIPEPVTVIFLLIGILNVRKRR